MLQSRMWDRSAGIASDMFPLASRFGPDWRAARTVGFWCLVSLGAKCVLACLRMSLSCCTGLKPCNVSRHDDRLRQTMFVRVVSPSASRFIPDWRASQAARVWRLVSLGVGVRYGSVWSRPHRRRSGRLRPRRPKRPSRPAWPSARPPRPSASSRSPLPCRCRPGPPVWYSALPPPPW